MNSKRLSNRRQVDSDSLSTPSNVSKLTVNFSYEFGTIQRILKHPREDSHDQARLRLMASFNPQQFIGPFFRTGDPNSPKNQEKPG
jgi:hypothetical protein